MLRRLIYVAMIVVFVLVGCSSPGAEANQQGTATFQPTGLLTPYLTVTPSPVKPSATFEMSIPVTPTPTPTPFIYVVKGDDTMLGIAIHYGISLDALKTANPTVDPHYMGEGLRLVIPIIIPTAESMATPTAVAVAASEPACYPTGDGGAWCIVAVQNETETSLENLSAWIGLFDDQGSAMTGQIAYAPLNILRPGDTMPLMTYFAPPLPDSFQARGEVTGALEVPSNDSRYIEAETTIESTEITADGGQGIVRGEVILPDGAPKLSQLWVLAVAYDGAGNVIGVRKWKSDGETSFEIPVYSLAGAIDHVKTLVEARP